MSVTTGSPPEAVPAGAAVLTEAVSAVLWLWDSLGLELGDRAVVTDGHPWARLAALGATWYGARPILVSKSVEPVLSVATHLHWTGADENTRQLAALLKGAPGAAVAELSGEAGIVDLVFEAVPPSSRVMLAGRAGDRLTIDFYQNVHIKGLHLLSGTLEAVPASAARADRVQRLLARPSFLAPCLEALGAPANSARA